jgi:hypothetical protein
MNDIKHFEQLWELSENQFKQDIGTISTAVILAELRAKLAVYEALDKSANVPAAEMQKLKSAIFGKILVSLTQLSLKDSVNTFAALKAALDNTAIDQLESKYYPTNPVPCKV